MLDQYAKDLRAWGNLYRSRDRLHEANLLETAAGHLDAKRTDANIAADLAGFSMAAAAKNQSSFADLLMNSAEALLPTKTD